MKNDLPISPNKKFNYSISFEAWDDESLEVGQTDNRGYEVEETTDEIGDILYEANTTYGIYMPFAFGRWESTYPDEDADFFEKGIRKFYTLHITNEDGTEISQEENDFITFLLSDGQYEVNKFRDYAVGGIVLGSIVLGIGALITYFYFKDGKNPSKSQQVEHNGRKYPTKGAWKKEHNLENKNEEHEVPQGDRKPLKYEMGGDLSVSKEDYFLVVQNWVYFTFNYPMGFIKDAFDSKHIQDKFSESYERFGSIGALMNFWGNLDGDNREKLSLWIKNNYFNGDKSKLQSISDDDYANIITHWNMFCFNFPYRFVPQVFVENPTHFEQKWNTEYEKAGATGAVNKFFTELSGDNQRLLTDWVYENYKGSKFEKGGSVNDIDMEGIEKSAKFYTDETRWTVPPTVEKFEAEIEEYQDLKKQLDNKEITPSKIIGKGHKSQYARGLAYKWIKERILIAEKAIEILQSRYSDGGEINTVSELYNSEQAQKYPYATDMVAYFIFGDKEDNKIADAIRGRFSNQTADESALSEIMLQYEYSWQDNMEEIQEQTISELGDLIDYYAGGGRVTTNDGIIEAFLTSNRELKVGNLATHFNENDDEILLRNYGTLIATRKGNDVQITNTKYSKTTSTITNKLKNMAMNKGMNVNHADKFADGGEAGSLKHKEDILECKKLVSAFCKMFGERFYLDEKEILEKVKYQDSLGYGAKVFISLNISSNIKDLKIGEVKPVSGYLVLSSGINPNGVSESIGIRRTYTIDLEIKGQKRYTQRRTDDGRYFKSFNYGLTIDEVLDKADTDFVYELFPLEKRDDLKIKMGSIFEKGGEVDENEAIEKLWIGYASAILFAEIDSDTEESLDENYSISDFDEETVKSSKDLMRKFYIENKKAIEQSGMDLDTIGNDIWYTRAGHGAGFFDHNLDEEIEGKLTKGAEALGEFPDVETYDGKISVRGGKVFEKGGEMKDGEEYAEGGEVEDWMEEALESLIEETGNETLEITMVSNGGNEFYASNENEEYRVFKSEDDAFVTAENEVREDMEESPDNFNKDFIRNYIDGRDYFQDALMEMNSSYADDIQNESHDKYSNRLISEMVDFGLIDEDDAESDNAEELAEEHKDDFITLMTEEQLNEGNDGLDYFISNFGEEETLRMVMDNNLIDIYRASKDAVQIDGVAHFLSHYDGETLYLSNGYVAFRNN